MGVAGKERVNFPKCADVAREACSLGGNYFCHLVGQKAFCNKRLFYQLLKGKHRVSIQSMLYLSYCRYQGVPVLVLTCMPPEAKRETLLFSTTNRHTTQRTGTAKAQQPETNTVENQQPCDPHDGGKAETLTVLLSFNNDKPLLQMKETKEEKINQNRLLTKNLLFPCSKHQRKQTVWILTM